jgi:hypothetical protein
VGVGGCRFGAARTAQGPIGYASPRRFGILTFAEGVLHCLGTWTIPLDDKIKQLLRELGTAINDSISNSEDVNEHIQRIRDEGYNLYVVLDATIGLNRLGEEEETPAPDPAAGMLVKSDKQVQFRINVNDLALLRALGIDPTRKVRGARRVEPLAAASDNE